MDKPSLKFNVMSQWMGSSGGICVSAVELARNETQQLMGGDYGVRVYFLDSRSGEQTVCITMNHNAAREFCELMAKAIGTIIEVMEDK